MSEGSEKQFRIMRLEDLDRCEHGRHVKDECFSCVSSDQDLNVLKNQFGVHNFGNPHKDTVIGYDVRGNPRTVADLFVNYNPDKKDRML